jgi:hypothetical protein
MIFAELRFVFISDNLRGMPVSLAGRIVAWSRWVCAGESLRGAPPGAPPAEPPGPGLCRFFLGEDPLPPPPVAPPADPAAAARPSFWRWLSTPEQLPRAAGAGTPKAEL